jgi:hypothetical protein
LIQVNQRDQVETGLETFTFESPEIEDPEGHPISIQVTGHENIAGA